MSVEVRAIGERVIRSVEKVIVGKHREVQLTLFPLPEAQLDRFLIRLSLGYPSKADEIDILDRQQQAHPLESVTQVVDARELIAAQQGIKSVYVDRLIKEYIVTIVEETRRHEDI